MVTYSLRQSGDALINTRKVPEITGLFWLLKLLTTALGESTSDYLVFRYNPYLAVILSAVVLLIALIIQFRAKKYVAWAYWLCVSMVAVFGTMAADGLHIRLHVPYTISSIVFAITLVLVFIIWYKSQHSLSIHTINNRKREVFYWATVLTTFALGTATGDLAASTLKLGYFTAGLVFAGIILVPLMLYKLFKISEVFCFWFAYIVTRPLGASFADWTGKSKAVGALGFGDAKVAIILALALIIGVIYLSISRSDVKVVRQTTGING